MRSTRFDEHGLEAGPDYQRPAPLRRRAQDGRALAPRAGSVPQPLRRGDPMAVRRQAHAGRHRSRASGYLPRGRSQRGPDPCECGLLPRARASPWVGAVIPPPLSLIAELTHACPLRCVYCSNPLALVERDSELDCFEWRSVIREAAALGVLHLHLSGGEPLLRSDLEELVAEGSGCGLYTNLITSGVGLSPGRAAALREAGLRHVQVSLQGDEQAA